MLLKRRGLRPLNSVERRINKLIFFQIKTEVTRPTGSRMASWACDREKEIRISAIEHVIFKVFIAFDLLIETVKSNSHSWSCTF